MARQQDFHPSSIPRGLLLKKPPSPINPMHAFWRIRLFCMAIGFNWDHQLCFFLFYRFNSFSLEASSTCRYDYVAVYDGENVLAPLMGKFCGQELPPNLRSSSNQMFLEFVTDSSVAAEGWRATYSETLGRVPSFFIKPKTYKQGTDLHWFASFQNLAICVTVYCLDMTP